MASATLMSSAEQYRWRESVEVKQHLALHLALRSLRECAVSAVLEMHSVSAA